MIEIREKANCCGCGGCVQICSKQCIRLLVDNEGFSYPHVDTTVCVDCGLCEKVCPVLNQSKQRRPLSISLAVNKNEAIRLRSSSGGIFTLLAEQVISEGGVVFGAKFDESWHVKHDYTDTLDGLEAFRGSKYVQSAVGSNYKIAKQFLEVGRKVLFSGTPCQIAGLKHFLQKEYENLLTVDVVCHGTPSPLIWQDYLIYKRAQYTAQENCKNLSLNEFPKITELSFRDKTNGWKKFGFKICFANKCEITPYYKDLFMRGFLKNIYLRPSCYACAARSGKSCSDLTLADFWGVEQTHPQMHDDKGTSLVLIYTQKGYQALDLQCAEVEVATYDEAITYNPCIEKNCKQPFNRALFFQLYEREGISAISKCVSMLRPSLLQRCLRFAKRVKNRLAR